MNAIAAAAVRCAPATTFLDGRRILVLLSLVEIHNTANFCAGASCCAGNSTFNSVWEALLSMSVYN